MPNLNRNLSAVAVYQVDDNGVIIPTNQTGAASNQVQGNAANGATDVGNPVKVAGKYNVTPPTVANGQRVDLQVSNRGLLLTQLSDGDKVASLNYASADNVPFGTVPGLLAISQGYNWNGTSWDRQRGDINGTWMLTTGTTLGISDGAGNFITCPRTPIGTAIAQLTYGLLFNGTGWDRQRGDVTGSWVHAPQNTVSTALSGSLATAGATATVAFVNTARQEVINASTGTIWASWGTPAVNGSGSFPIASGGSFSTDRTTGTLTLLSTAATQAYTVNRYA